MDEELLCRRFGDSEIDLWRERVIQAELRYREHPGAETRNEYLRALEVFKDFVLYGKAPLEPTKKYVGGKELSGHLVDARFAR